MLYIDRSDLESTTSTLQRASGDLSAPRLSRFQGIDTNSFDSKGVVPVDSLGRELQLRGGTIGGAYSGEQNDLVVFFDLLRWKDFQSGLILLEDGRL